MAIPETIKKLANDVRTKVYGREVRESLAKGIEAAGETAEDARIKSEGTEIRQTVLEKQFDDEIANMTLADPSSAEIVAARTNANTGESYDTIGRRLDAEHANVTTQLADTMNVSSVGAIGNGTDETTILLNAFNSARNANRVLVLNSNKNYKINTSDVLNLPSIEGNGATLTIAGNPIFNFGYNTKISNLNIVTEQIWENANIPGSPFIKFDGVENCVMENVHFYAPATEDGSSRSKIAIQVNSCKNMKFNNVTGYGYRAALQVLNYSEDIYVDGLHFKNTELVFSAKGSPTNVTGGNYIKGLHLNDISQINTATQQSNYQLHKGADTVLLEKCDGVFIDNIYSERSAERSIYMSCCKNVTGGTVRIKDTQGVKFTGNLRYDLNLQEIAQNCHFEQIHSITTDFVDAFAFSTYDAENVKVDNIYMEGNNNAHVAIMTSRFIKNVEFNSVTANNVKRGVFEYVHMGDIPPEPAFDIPAQLESDYLSLVDGLTFNQINGKRTNILGYEVIRFVNHGTPKPQGEYRYKNLKIHNVFVDNQQGYYDVFNEISGTGNPTICTGIIDIDEVVNMDIANCQIKGFKGKLVNNSPSQIPFYIGSNSAHVVLKHTETVRNAQYKKYVIPTLYLSANSEIKLISIDRITKLNGVDILRPKTSSVSNTGVVNLAENFIVSGEMNVTGSGDGLYTILGYDSNSFVIPALTGKVEIILSGGEIATYTIGSTQQSIKKSGDAIFGTAVELEKASFYKDGGFPRFIVRDKISSNPNFIIKYELATA